MEIFHFVAVQLQHTPLFESELLEREESGTERVGAIYNDYDQRSPFQNEVTPTIEPTQPRIQAKPSLETEEIDHAILEADKSEGILSDQTSFFENENFDIYSEGPDALYHDKVCSN